MSILDKLRGLSGATALSKVLPAIDAELAALDARLISLKGSMPAAAFDLPADEVRELRRKVRDTEDEIEVLNAAKDETIRRRDSALRSEAEEHIKLHMQEAGKARAALRRAAADYDQALNAVARASERMRASYEIVEAANREAELANFPALKLQCPMWGHTWGPGGQANPNIGALRLLSPSSAFDQLEASGALEATTK